MPNNFHILIILCFFVYRMFMKEDGERKKWRKRWKKDKNVERKNSKYIDAKVRYRANGKDSTITPLILNIPKVSFLSFFIPPIWARMASCFEVFHVPVALQKLARRDEASRARLYIKWCSRFTSQIESRAIGRFSISFNNGLCYTSPTSSGPLFLFSSSRRLSYFHSARSRISPQERIHRASRCWGFIPTVWYP